MSLPFKQSIKDFIFKYDIEVLDASRRTAIMRPVSYFVNPDDKNVMSTDTDSHYTEPLVTLTIPLSRFEGIVNIESTFFNNIESVGSRRVFESWIQLQEKERALRHKYEAVKLAYQNYSAMLAWCESGKNPTDFKPLPDEV